MNLAQGLPKSAELAFATQLECQIKEYSEATETCKKKLTNKVQGLKNNCRGLAAELQVAKALPGVVGLSQSFPLNAKGQSLSCEANLFSE